MDRYRSAPDPGTRGDAGMMRIILGAIQLAGLLLLWTIFSHI
jgi:hypothetical protein